MGEFGDRYFGTEDDPPPHFFGAGLSGEGGEGEGGDYVDGGGASGIGTAAQKATTGSTR